MPGIGKLYLPFISLHFDILLLSLPHLQHRETVVSKVEEIVGYSPADSPMADPLTDPSDALKEAEKEEEKDSSEVGKEMVTINKCISL